jgi:hypothetical protein
MLYNPEIICIESICQVVAQHRKFFHILHGKFLKQPSFAAYGFPTGTLPRLCHHVLLPIPILLLTEDEQWRTE